MPIWLQFVVSIVILAGSVFLFYWIGIRPIGEDVPFEARAAPVESLLRVQMIHEYNQGNMLMGCLVSVIGGAVGFCIGAWALIRIFTGG